MANIFVRLGFVALVLGCLASANRWDANNTGSSPAVMISAHRGASHTAPENTLAAFTLAMDQGTDFIEIDVRTSSDGAQVIMHDASLARTTGMDALVKSTPLAEIRKLSAGQWFGPDFNHEGVPTLEEVCSLVSLSNARRDNSVALYVDCKDINVEKVVRALEKYKLLETAVFYGDPQTLAALKRVYGKAKLMPPYPGKEQVNDLVDTLDPYAFDVRFTDLSEAVVTECHRRDIRVFSDLLGQFDRAANYRHAIGLGIDLIQTDDVPSVKKVLKETK